MSEEVEATSERTNVTRVYPNIPENVTFSLEEILTCRGKFVSTRDGWISRTTSPYSILLQVLLFVGFVATLIYATCMYIV